jgi:hypothetical protein
MASLASPIGYAMFSHAPSGGMAEYIAEKAAANKSLSHHLPADSLQRRWDTNRRDAACEVPFSHTFEEEFGS